MTDDVNREDEHADTLNRHGVRLSQHDSEIASINQVLIGDNKRRYAGLLERVEINERSIAEIERRWDRVVVSVRVAMVILTLTGLGVWMPYLQTLTKMIGG